MNVGMLLSNEVIRDTRVLLEARALARNGHRVRIVGWDRFDPSVPDGPIEEGVEIALVRSTGIMAALPGALLKNPVFWRRAVERSLERPADLWYAHDLDTLQAGVWLKERTGSPLIFDAHEVFAEMIRDDYPQRIARAAEKLETKLLRSVDHMITVNPALEAHYKETRLPVTVVMSCRAEIDDRYVPPTAPNFTVLYVGTLHRQRFIFELIQAVQETDGVHLKIGGYKSLSEDVRRACAASPRTTFLGPVPADRVIPLTRECHVVAAMLDPSNANNRMGTPNKLWEAMAVGRPILATRGTMSGNIVETHECGLAVDYGLPACKWALSRLSKDSQLSTKFGENALRAAREEFNWAAQEENLLSAVNRFGRPTV